MQLFISDGKTSQLLPISYPLPPLIIFSEDNSDQPLLSIIRWLDTCKVLRLGPDISKTVHIPPEAAFFLSLYPQALAILNEKDVEEFTLDEALSLMYIPLREKDFADFTLDIKNTPTVILDLERETSTFDPCDEELDSGEE